MCPEPTNPILPSSNNESLEQTQKKFWHFVDGFVESPEALYNFCQKQGLTLMDRLGGGGFGSVYRVRNLCTGQLLALKVLDFMPHQPGIFPRFYSKDGQAFCHIEVETKSTLRSILTQEKVAASWQSLLPFFVACRAEDEDSDLAWEQILYPALLQQCCPAANWQRGEDTFLPGLGETWLHEVFSASKAEQLSVWDVMQLAPTLCTQSLWDGGYRRSAGQEIFPVNLEMSWQSMLDELAPWPPATRSLLLREFLYDETMPDRPYWQYERLGEAAEALIRQHWATRRIRLNVIWERYGLHEIFSRFPCFFDLSLTRRVPAKVALPYVQGDMKQEIKRLLAVQNEVLMANAMQTPSQGINTVAATPAQIGSNVVLLSPLLADAHTVLGERFALPVQELYDNEVRTRQILAFPVVLQFLWYIADLLKNSPWELGDIKEGNFKMNRAGGWQLLDYGGHFLHTQEARTWEDLLGSNDYASYSLFRAMNAAAAREVPPKLFAQAQSKNSRWFSAVKAAVRMMSGKGADSLRGGDLNQALYRDFQGYHEKLFAQLIEVLLDDASSPYHFRHFALSDSDVAHLFPAGQNPGVEVALRRFLFVIGLTLTGEFAWSLLDADMQKRLVLQPRRSSLPHTSWQVSLQLDKIVVTECVTEVMSPLRQGLYPGEARKLLKAMFPRLEDWYEEEQRVLQERQKVIDILCEIGAPNTEYLNVPAPLARLESDIRASLESLANAAWLDSAAIMRIICQREKWQQLLQQDNTPGLEQNPLAFANIATMKNLFDCEIADKLRHELLALLAKPALPLCDVGRLLDQIVVWERLCFHKYLAGEVTREHAQHLDVQRTQLFFRERMLFARAALEQRELAKHMVEIGWLQQATNQAVEAIGDMSACDDKNEGMTLLCHELSRTGEPLSDTEITFLVGHYRQVHEEERRRSEAHPMFPSPLKEKRWQPAQLLELLRPTAAENLPPLSPEQRHVWHEATASQAVAGDFPLAVLDVCRSLLTLWQELGVTLWGKILGCTTSDQTSVPGTWQEWCELSQRWSIYLGTAASDNPLLTVLDLYRRALYLENRLCCLRQAIAGHTLFLGLPEQADPLLHLWQQAQSLSPEAKNNVTCVLLDDLATQLALLPQEVWRRQEASWLLATAYLPAIARLFCQQQSRWPVAMPRLYCDAPLQSAGEDSPLPPVITQDFKPAMLAGWPGDRLKNRIARFLGETNPDGFPLGDEERSAIVQILLWCHEQQGLKLAFDDIDPSQPAVAIYQSLQSYSDDFRKLPPLLQDMKNIAWLAAQQMNPEQVRQEFFALIPAEVQPPQFSRSVLREFLENQLDISTYEESKSEPAKGLQLRKNILCRQMAREVEELTPRLSTVRSKYAEYLRRVENLAMLRADTASITLQQEAKDRWPALLQIFSDYLATARQVVAQQNARWDWRVFLTTPHNTFLQNLYPELQDDELRDIFLLIFSLSPLPPVSKVREFMRQCHLFDLTSEQKQKLRQLLSEANVSVQQKFEQAVGYVQKSCWSVTEENVRSQLAQTGLEAANKTRLWQEYLSARSKLPATRRIERSKKFSEFLANESDPQKVARRIGQEIWLTRFQGLADANIVRYFAEQLESGSEDKQARIGDILERTPGGGDHLALFGWLFQEYLFFPRLRLFDHGYTTRRLIEDIITLLATKYTHQVLLELEYNMLKSMDEKAAAGWPAAKVLEFVKGLI
jgi:hypothetical protein